MKIEAKKVIFIEGIGYFNHEDEWNGLSRWGQIDGNEHFIAKKEELLSFNNIFGCFQTGGMDLEIILCSPSLAGELKKVKDNP